MYAIAADLCVLSELPSFRFSALVEFLSHRYGRVGPSSFELPLLCARPSFCLIGTGRASMSSRAPRRTFPTATTGRCLRIDQLSATFERQLLPAARFSAVSEVSGAATRSAVCLPCRAAVQLALR